LGRERRDEGGVTAVGVMPVEVEIPGSVIVVALIPPSRGGLIIE
jgi:hypothetical protein